MKYEHEHNPKQISGDRCFVGSVAFEPFTHEHRAAHGGITYTEECTVCGAQRSVNANMGFREYSPWGPDREAREKYEREQSEIRRLRENANLRALAASQCRITRLTDDYAYISRKGLTSKAIAISEIRAAANQPDTGDGLVPFYRGLLLMIEEAR